MSSAASKNKWEASAEKFKDAKKSMRVMAVPGYGLAVLIAVLGAMILVNDYIGG